MLLYINSVVLELNRLQRRSKAKVEADHSLSGIVQDAIINTSEHEERSRFLHLQKRQGHGFTSTSAHVIILFPTDTGMFTPSLSY